VIDEDGKICSHLLGNNLVNDEEFQIIIKKNSWFAAEVVDKKSFALIGCTVSPGFDFSDFELANRKELINNFPEHQEIIKRFTKP